MMSRKRLAPFLVLLSLLVGAPVFSHHSVAVNFDRSREVTIEGMLTEITWRNPHSHFRVHVVQEDGAELDWLVEMGAINTMARAGFETELFVVDNPITIVGWPGWRDRTVYLIEAVLHDGTELVCAGAPCSRER